MKPNASIFGVTVALATLLDAAWAQGAPNTSTTPKTENSDFLITPGEAIGHTKMWMKVDEVDKKLGKSNGTYNPPDSDYAEYWTAKTSGSTVRVYFQVGKVSQISVTSPGFRTKDGLSVASSQADFEAVHPNAKHIPFTANHGVIGTYLDDDKAGLVFEVTMQGDGAQRAPKSYAMLVHAPGGRVELEPDEMPGGDGKTQTAATPATAPATGTATAGAQDQNDNLDGCVFDAHAGSAILDQKSRKLSKYLGAKDIPYDFQESGVLLDGTIVTYGMGGCAHMGYSFTFAGFPALKSTDVPALIDLAQRLLAATPEVNNSHQRQAFLDALAKANKAPPATKDGVMELPCDDPWTCELTMQSDGKLLLTLDSGL